jgi:cytochrome bd-type quinol oxidase subunit 1
MRWTLARWQFAVTFGWDNLPKRAHLATIWLASTGTILSAYFIILAANSWMRPAAPCS